MLNDGIITFSVRPFPFLPSTARSLCVASRTIAVAVSSTLIMPSLSASFYREISVQTCDFSAS